MQTLRKMDVVIICFFILLAVLLIFAFMFAGTRGGAVAVVFADGAEVLVVDIGQNEGERFEIFSLNGINKILIEGGAVRMVHADCPDKYCMRMGAISGTFQTITCLPNRVIVEIRGGGVVGYGVDIISH